MSIHIECEECFREYNVKDEFAGRKFRCKECGHPLLVPSIKTKKVKETPQKRKGKKKETKNSSGMFVSVMACVIIVLLLGGGVFYFLSGSEERELFTNLTLLEQKASTLEIQENYDQAISQYQEIEKEISGFEEPSERLNSLKKKCQDSTKRCEDARNQKQLLAKQEEDLKSITPLATEVQELSKASKYQETFDKYVVFLEQANSLEHKSDDLNSLIKQVEESVQILFEAWATELEALAEKQTSSGQYKEASSTYEAISSNTDKLGKIVTSLDILKTLQAKQELNSVYQKLHELNQEYRFEDTIELAKNNNTEDPVIQKLLAIAEKELILQKKEEVRKAKENRLLASFGKISPASSEFAEKLDNLNKTPESLLELAKWCQEKELFLESDDCLRAVLAADPNNEEAKNLYQEIAPEISHQSISPIIPSAEKVLFLEDAKIRIPAPENHYLVKLPVYIDSSQDNIRIGKGTLKGITNGQAAKFLGVYHAPHRNRFITSSVKPNSISKNPDILKREEYRYLRDYEEQLWEELITDKEDGEIIFELKNREMPTHKMSSKPGKSSKSKKKKSKKKKNKNEETKDNEEIQQNKHKVNHVKSNLSFKETPANVYFLAFAVPINEFLVEISYKNEEPIRLFENSTSKDIKKIAFSTELPLEERMAAIQWLFPIQFFNSKDHLPYYLSKSLNYMELMKKKSELKAKTSLSLSEINQLLSSQDHELLVSLRKLLREYRRKNNLIHPLFVINSPQKHIFSLNVFKKKPPKTSYKNPKGSRVSEVIVAGFKSPQVEFKTMFRVRNPGNILFRLHTYQIQDSSKRRPGLANERNQVSSQKMNQEVKKVSYLEIPGKIDEPGAYLWDFRIFEGDSIQLAEIWQNGKLLEYKFFNADQTTRQEILNTTLIQPVENLDSTVEDLDDLYTNRLEKLNEEKEELTPGSGDYSWNNRHLIHANIALKILNPNLVATSTDGMSENQFISMIYLKSQLPDAKEEVISNLLEQVKLLESEEESIAKQAEAEITNVLQNKSAGLYAEIAKNNSGEIRKRLITETLMRIAATKAEGCRELIELARSSNPQCSQIAKASVNKLIQSGIIQRQRVGGKKEYRIVNGKPQELQFGGQPSFTYHGSIHPGIADF